MAAITHESTKVHTAVAPFSSNVLLYVKDNVKNSPAIAHVSYPNLGKEFLECFELPLDVKIGRLLDSQTSLSVKGNFSFTNSLGLTPKAHNGAVEGFHYQLKSALMSHLPDSKLGCSSFCITRSFVNMGAPIFVRSLGRHVHSLRPIDEKHVSIVCLKLANQSPDEVNADILSVVPSFDVVTRYTIFSCDSLQEFIVFVTARGVL
ncbi:hypothetical protein NPIL_555411 [Nephila pilipes]|uniref:Uncharacterized protein n=1 Tax=Nephila pilipes TaxID=299642 RepID=A0A8X6PAE2_NEPPI|nr:hypothetical protein NPIL_555411 [Nephila pilipes]